MKSIYDSGLHHPLAAYVIGGLFLGYLASLAYARLGAKRLPTNRRWLWLYAAAFTLEILADATVTGAWTPIRPSSPLAESLAIFFVILGDFRYFVLAEHLTRPRDARARMIARALGISLVVPVASGLMSKVVPAMGVDARVLFLVYELMLFTLVLGLHFGVYARRREAPPANAWLAKVSGFVLVQYAGWALADVVILAGYEVGYVFRIVPNVMYYAFFVPFVWFSRSDEVSGA